MHAAGPRRGAGRARVRWRHGRGGAECGHRQSAGLRGRDHHQRREFPWPAGGDGARRPRDRAHQPRDDLGAAHRSARAPRSQPGTPALSHQRCRRVVGIHDGAGHRGVAGQRVQGALASRQRGHYSHRRKQGRRRADGDGRGVEASPRDRQRRQHPGDRADVRRPGHRLPRAARSGTRRCRGAPARARARAAAGGRPGAQYRYRRNRDSGATRRVRDARRGAGLVTLAARGSAAMPPTARVVRAPRGSVISCKTWAAEAALRMLMNNLDPEVAERPEDLVVYGGIGKAARDWPSFDRIVDELRALEADQTLLVQSGKPVGVFRTHADAPRVLIANSNLVPKWATWEHFDELDRKGLMMYGQMTAGSWIYIGTQGIVQGTYETFMEAGRQHYGGDWSGKWILTAGLGGMGGAQPLAATMAGASCLAVECQRSRIEMRLRTRYLDVMAETLD